MIYIIYVHIFPSVYIYIYIFPTIYYIASTLYGQYIHYMASQYPCYQERKCPTAVTRRQAVGSMSKV